MLSNNFGKLSYAYKAARKGYPENVFTHLKSLVNTEKVETLDIGCGTGISTRQLKEFGFNVIGCDKDSEMVNRAKSEDDLKYVVAPTHDLPLDSSQFDIVTAFTAFHWFADAESISEIKRVLKKDGTFFVVNKVYSKNSAQKDFNQGYRDILTKYVKGEYNSSKNFYPVKILEEYDFKSVTEKIFYCVDRYSVDDALLLATSFSYWNLVPEESKEEMLQELRTLYENNLIDGFVVREWDVVCVSGTK